MSTLETVRKVLERTHRRLVGAVGELTVEGGNTATVRAMTKLAKATADTIATLA